MIRSCYCCDARTRRAALDRKLAACHEAVAVNGRAPDCLFGRSAEEAERLRLQARMFAPYIVRFLEDADVSPGMKVLHLRTGIDFSAELLETAAARAAATGTEHVSFAPVVRLRRGRSRIP